MHKLLTLAAGLSICMATAATAETPVEHGKYLVKIMGCGDCHTPGSFLGKPDMSRELAGSDVGFTIPGVGAFFGRNLTSDKKTGLGDWTEDQIITAVTTGVRPDGRHLAPIMPYMDFAALSPDDAKAIGAYLKSLPPISNAVPGPFGPDQTPQGLVFVIVPGDVYAHMPKPKP
jgi:mono/diheme cytochrome c family protein